MQNPARGQQIAAGLQRLGPDAMLADVSPEWLRVARGAASRPGQRDPIVNACSIAMPARIFACGRI